MPTYEYECQACHHQFEVEQKIKDAPLQECPDCKELKLERLISASAFHLKGGGWYKDAYGSTGTKRTENQRIDKLESKIKESNAKETASKGSGGDSSGGSST